MSYSDDVRDIAEEIVDEHGLDESNWHTPIHESVDGSSWIIYTANHEEVLQYTDHSPDNAEISAMSSPESDWQAMRQTAAFLAMEQDVWAACRDYASDCEDKIGPPSDPETCEFTVSFDVESKTWEDLDDIKGELTDAISAVLKKHLQGHLDEADNDLDLKISGFEVDEA